MNILLKLLKNNFCGFNWLNMTLSGRNYPIRTRSWPNDKLGAASSRNGTKWSVKFTNKSSWKTLREKREANKLRTIKFCCLLVLHQVYYIFVRYIFASLLLSLKESTCQTRKNVFYFTLKALFVLEKIKI